MNLCWSVSALVWQPQPVSEARSSKADAAFLRSRVSGWGVIEQCYGRYMEFEVDPLEICPMIMISNLSSEEPDGREMSVFSNHKGMMILGSHICLFTMQTVTRGGKRWVLWDVARPRVLAGEGNLGRVLDTRTLWAISRSEAWRCRSRTR
ncbi:hypothetical protein K470DRAFT_68701 [Piedraia hortae CBS 480.64]|uniref:Uncharacterized protein n=1 Tax=Piedraia hortae CBS 480.64 TaxID=1314780 RepID=A0A6A7BZD1_9PEZI|nr:hypothetical protein K470DRAFT_68701 [Piedraia hortae CBS 480.64]